MCWKQVKNIFDYASQHFYLSKTSREGFFIPCVLFRVLLCSCDRFFSFFFFLQTVTLDTCFHVYTSYSANFNHLLLLFTFYATEFFISAYIYVIFYVYDLRFLCITSFCNPKRNHISKLLSFQSFKLFSCVKCRLHVI